MALTMDDYYTPKAREFFHYHLGWDADNAGQVAQWAHDQRAAGDYAHGIVVAADGQIVARTFRSPDGAASVGAWYVDREDARRLGLLGNVADMAVASLRRTLGQPVAHITIWDVGTGPRERIRPVP